MTAMVNPWNTLAFTKWRSGEPNSAYEDCTIIAPEASPNEWWDISCSHPERAICELPTEVCSIDNGGIYTL